VIGYGYVPAGEEPRRRWRRFFEQQMTPAIRPSTTTVATATETPITVPFVADGDGDDRGDDDDGDVGAGGVSGGGEGGERGRPSTFGGDGVTPGGAGRPR